MGIKVIVTGITGMVGEGVLIECLQNPGVEAVLAVCRKPLDQAHSKLQTFLATDFLELSSESLQLRGYDACFYCAGVSSNGLSEENYLRYDDSLCESDLAAEPKASVQFCFRVSNG
jgi:nucleoside-diphosphate-sugar epimerase